MKTIISTIITLTLVISGWLVYRSLETSQSTNTSVSKEQQVAQDLPVIKNSKSKLGENGLMYYSGSIASSPIIVAIDFSEQDAELFIKWTDNAFKIFTNTYRNMDGLEIAFMDDISFQNILEKMGYSAEDRKTASGITNGKSSMAMFNADKLKIGLTVLNPSGDGAVKTPEDVITHEIAHVAFEKCLCKKAWLNLSHRTEGYVSRYGQHYSSATWEEDFAETVVGYKNSAGNPAKISDDKQQQEAIREKFNFLITNNIVGHIFN